MKLVSNHQISPYCNTKHDIAKTYLMLHEAISLLPKSWYSEPILENPSSDEELALEQERQHQAEKAKDEIKRLAGEIYKALTGEGIVDERHEHNICHHCN